MSGRSVTITIGSTGSIRTTPVPRSSGTATLAGDKSKDKMYEPKHSQKMVRVLTVVAYMFTVSLAAIMLSVYYVFLWTPRYASRMMPANMPVVSASTTPNVTHMSNATHILNATDGGVPIVSALVSTPPGTSQCSCPTTGTVPSDGERFGSSEDAEGNQLSGELSTDGFGSQPDVVYDRGPD